MPKRIILLIIDPQNDLCDPSGAVYVRGADADMTRLAAFIQKHSGSLADMIVTMDSHHEIHIAHPTFWRNAEGNQPEPFACITHQDVERGVWRIAVSSTTLRRRVVEYLKAAEPKGRGSLVIWPPHCIIGSQGHNIFPVLHDAIRNWERTTFATASIVTKGSNPFVEYHSALQALIPDPADPATHLNTELLAQLKEADMVLVAGEPGTHTVAATLRDIADAMPTVGQMRKFFMLADAMSPAPGFERMQIQVIKELKARGVQTTTTAEFAP